MDGPIRSAKFKAVDFETIRLIDDIFDKHGFGRCSLTGNFQRDVDDLIDKYCSLIIHLDKTVDDLQYKLAGARGEPKK